MDSPSQQGYPRGIIFTFLIFTIYLAIPLIDVPFLGLSISAPLFFLVTLASLARPPEYWLGRYKRWVGLAAALWLGITLSSLLNGFKSSGQNFLSIDVVNLVRYTYWLIVFVVTVYFVSRNQLGTRITNWLGLGILLLALARWGEAIFYGRIGTANGSILLTPNAYGFLFSTFAPFLLPPLFQARGAKRLAAFGAALVVWGAVLLNGSRSSWVAVSLSVVLYIGFYLWSSPKKTRTLLAILIISITTLTAFIALPEQINQTINERYATLDQLELDKSYVIRELMIQKGLRLFQESPIIGIGIGRFTLSSTPLDIPDILRYAEQSHFDEKSSHNSYIALLAETGLAGTLPFALLLLVLFFGGLRSTLRLQRSGHSWALGMYISFIGMSIHMWSISTLTNTVVWFVYGLVGAMIVLAKAEKTNHAK